MVLMPCLTAMLCGFALAQEPYPSGDRPAPAASEAPRPPEAAVATADAVSADSICLLIEAAAGQHGLPVTFLTRLIAQESGFRPSVVGPVTRSGARAQGIAQFMPYTARERGPLDPFDPVQALPHAASIWRTCDGSSAASALPLRPTMPARSAFRTGSTARADCRPRLATMWR